ncbi:MAG TPA: phosphatase PAP2 family protein [Burkholderiaceae bacterium]|nr:phosphatase PAP2 family protein [Burkholderiaceae bacterium]
MTSRIVWERWVERDRDCARWFNRAAERKRIHSACRVASRLGDGMLWYSMLFVLPWFGMAGRDCAWQMGIAGLVNLAVYYVVKRTMGRPRPYEACDDIQLCGRVLDRFSFPSGHALHATTFTLVLAAHFPHVAIVLAPLAALIALSRIVLGLHYPSDVLAGVVVGTASAAAVITINFGFGF